MTKTRHMARFRLTAYSFSLSNATSLKLPSATALACTRPFYHQSISNAPVIQSLSLDSNVAVTAIATSLCSTLCMQQVQLCIS